MKILHLSSPVRPVSNNSNSCPSPKHSSRKEKACSSIFFVSLSFSFRNLQTLPNLSPICSIPSATSEICSSFNWKKYSSRILICSSSLAASSAVRSSEQIFASSAFLLEATNCSIASTLFFSCKKIFSNLRFSYSFSVFSSIF